MAADEPAVENISTLLRAWSNGDQSALEALTPIVYDELHSLARRYMQRERPGHSLQTTALVNEAYMRLVDYERMQWQNRAHFFAVSAQDGCVIERDMLHAASAFQVVASGMLFPPRDKSHQSIAYLG